MAGIGCRGVARVPLWIALLVGGCVSIPTNFPIRTQVDGGRGFSMQGALKYTDDPAKTRARIEKAFVSACGGPVVVVQFEMKRRDNSFGVKFYEYEALARCTSPMVN